MPSPGAHIIAATLVQKVLPVNDSVAFVAGAYWPDIRYLGVINRDKTHLPGVTWDQIKDENDQWRKGVLHHSWLDDRWNETFPELTYIETSGLKAFADEYFWELLPAEQWQKLTHELLIVDPHEAIADIDHASLVIWHELIATIARERPDADSARDFTIRLGFESTIIDEVLAARARWVRDQTMATRLDDFEKKYLHGDQLL